MTTRFSYSLAARAACRFSSSVASSGGISQVARRALCHHHPHARLPTPPPSRAKKNQFFAVSRRNFSNQGPAGKKSSSSSSLVWQAATLVVVGGTFVALTSYLNGPSFRDDISDEDDILDPAPPQAEITSRAYFDINIGGKPAGRIVIGLYGNVVPKTVKNFETICQGTEQIGNIRLAYENSTFHRIIPGFMIQGRSCLYLHECFLIVCFDPSFC